MFPSENISHPIAPPTVPQTAVPSATAPQRAMAVETVPVLHLINGEYYAGAERVQDLLARNLPAHGFSVSFACVKLDLFDALRQWHEAPLFNVPMLGRFDLLASLRVARLVRQGGFRLIHAHSVRTSLVGSLASSISGVPMVYHVHSPASRDSTRRWMDRCNAQIERLSLARASRLIVVSHSLADHMMGEGFDPAHIAVVHNGVPAVDQRSDRQPPCGTWTLGVVALFRPRKGIEVLLDAVDRLRRQGAAVHLRAVGAFESPKYAAQIAAQIERLELTKHVTWTGFANDVTGELQQMDLLVLPSLFGEGLPMVVLEAMAAGVPVVATRVEGVSEAIRDGQDGVLAKPGDADDLARAIGDVIGGRYDWSTMRASALARHAAEFSDRAMAAGVAAVYRDVLGQ
jgi:glycosyltransferase involved in cell wall biosynthesis